MILFFYIYLLVIYNVWLNTYVNSIIEFSKKFKNYLIFMQGSVA